MLAAARTGRVATGTRAAGRRRARAGGAADLYAGRPVVGGRVLRAARRRAGQRRPDPAADPDRRGDRADRRDRRAATTRPACSRGESSASSRRRARVAAGNFSRPIPVDSEDELGQLARAFNEMQRKLARLDRHARSSSRTHRTSCARRSSRSEGSWSCSRTRSSTRRRGRSSSQPCASQVDRLQKLATDLLDLSRLDAGSLDLEREPVPLRALANQIAYEFAAAAAQSASRSRSWAPARPATSRPSATPSESPRSCGCCSTTLSTHTPPGTRVSVRVGSETGSAAGGRAARGRRRRAGDQAA